MRKKSATALISAGAFSLGLAVAVPLAVSPALLKAPGEISLTTHSRSSAEKLNPTTGQLETVQIDLTRNIGTHLVKGKVAGSSDVAVYDELLDLKVVNADGTLPPSVDANGKYTGLKAGTAVYAFDRSTGEAVTGFGSSVKTGGQTVKFPFGTEKKTYQYYDQTSQRYWPVSFVRETTVKGLDVYEFQGTIPETDLGQYGLLENTRTLYSNNGRTVLVEPVTGSIVSSTTAPQTKIQFADGTVKPALLVQSLVPTDAVVSERVAYAKDSKSSALMLQRAPWALGALGLLLLGGGWWIGRRRAAEGPDGSPRRTIDLTVPSPRASADADARSHAKH